MAAKLKCQKCGKEFWGDAPAEGELVRCEQCREALNPSEAVEQEAESLFGAFDETEKKEPAEEREAVETPAAETPAAETLVVPLPPAQAEASAQEEAAPSAEATPQETLVVPLAAATPEGPAVAPAPEAREEAPPQETLVVPLAAAVPEGPAAGREEAREEEPDERAGAPAVPIVAATAPIPAVEERRAPAAAAARPPEAPEERHRLATIYCLAFVVLLAFLATELFESSYQAFMGPAPDGLTGQAGYAGAIVAKSARAIGLGLMRTRECFAPSAQSPEKRFGLGDRMLLAFVALTLLIRFALKIRMFDRLYLDLKSWQSRSASGIFVNFLGLVAVLGLTGWFIALLKTPHEALLCGAICGVLLAAGAWFAILFFSLGGRRNPELLPLLASGAANLAFGALLIGYFCVAPRYSRIFTLAEGTALLCLLNSVIAYDIAGGAYLGPARPRAFLRHAAFLLAGFVGVALVALAVAGHCS